MNAIDLCRCSLFIPLVAILSGCELTYEVGGGVDLASDRSCKRSARDTSATRPVDCARDRVLDQGLEELANESNPKIVGGDIVEEGQFPFQVSLVWNRTPEGYEYYGHFCGGTLVSRRWILTAAHCIHNTDRDELEVLLGTTKLSRTGVKSGRRLKVRVVKPHPSYNPVTHNNDIALIQLIKGSPGDLAPVSINNIDGAMDVNMIFTTIGWGADAEGATGTALLRSVNVPVQDRQTCQDNYRNKTEKPNLVITNNMWCAGREEGGKDSCQGDSGGFIGHQIGGQWQQTGIVSWGHGCARPRLFGVYTLLANYADQGGWLEQTMAAYADN